MSWYNKVIWSEGMFLRTQHFQQADRYTERLVRGATAGLRPHGWGVRELVINRDLLEIGKFAVTRARGVLPDGTPFAIPDDADPPPPIALSERVRDCLIHLTLPLRQPGGVEVAPAGVEDTVARYQVRETEVVDSNQGADGSAPMQVGQPRLRYRLATEELAGYATIGLARVIEVRADGKVLIDEKYVPSALACEAAPVLTGYLAELQGLLNYRAEALAARVNPSSRSGVAEIADFLLLQTVNRYTPVLDHFAGLAELHPEQLYVTLVQLAGDLASFAAQDRRAPSFPVYRHDDLEASFAPVMIELRQSLSAVLEQTALQMPLLERKYGIRVAQITDRTLLGNAIFVLSVKSDMPGDQLRRHFPNQIKIGPVEQIRELVNVALPGIKVRPLPVAPRQIPYHSGATYFELERAGPYWQALANSGGFAFHLPQDYQSLDMEFWAIKG